MDLKCRKCNERVVECATCRGKGSVGSIGGRSNCTRCSGTGHQSLRYGKHWR
jgi:hypothetical protein